MTAAQPPKATDSAADNRRDMTTVHEEDLTRFVVAALHHGYTVVATLAADLGVLPDEKGSASLLWRDRRTLADASRTSLRTSRATACGAAGMLAVEDFSSQTASNVSFKPLPTTEWSVAVPQSGCSLRCS